MPEIISCPDCDRKLRVPEDLLGKKVKCPGCGVTFTATLGGKAAPAQPPAAKSSPKPPREGIEETPRASKRPAMTPPEEEEDRPRRRGRQEDEEDEDRPRRSRAVDEEYEEEGDDEEAPRTSPREGWKKVRLGIMLIITAIFVAIGGSILLQLLIVAGGAAAISINPRTGAITMGGLMIAAIVLGKLVNYTALGLSIAGHGLNMAVPPRRGISLKGLAVTTFSLYATAAGLALLLDVISLAMFGMAGMGAMAAAPFPMVGPGGSGGAAVLVMVTAVMAGLCSLAGWFCFMFLLRGIALAFSKHGLAKTIVTYMITAVSLVAGGLLLGCVGLMVFGMTMFNMAATAGPRGPNPQAMGNAGMMGGFLAIALGCIAALVLLAMFIWYIVILFQVRGVVESYLRRR